MSEDPFLENTEGPDGSFVELTIKGGQYQSHVVTVRKATLDQVEAQLPDAIKAVVGAQASLELAIKEQKSQPDVPKPGSYGKPVGADQSSNTDIPFADSVGADQAKAVTCKHGDMTLLTYNGQSGWVCVKPKGDPERCASIPA